MHLQQSRGHITTMVSSTNNIYRFKKTTRSPVHRCTLTNLLHIGEESKGLSHIGQVMDSHFSSLSRLQEDTQGDVSNPMSSGEMTNEPYAVLVVSYTPPW